MKTKILTLALLSMLGLTAANLSAEEKKADVEKAGDKVVSLDINKKIEESEAKSKMTEPNFGYVGCFGTFGASKDQPAACFVIHQYPDVHKNALGHTKLKFVGAKRLGNVDGWVYQTEWDGKNYPSKVFLSSEKVYFGGGVSAYIVADFRDETGWTWKFQPMHRMEIAATK